MPEEPIYSCELSVFRKADMRGLRFTFRFGYRPALGYTRRTDLDVLFPERSEGLKVSGDVVVVRQDGIEITRSKIQ
jgi:hypothetical protein